MTTPNDEESANAAEPWMVAVGTGFVFLRAAEHVIGGRPTALNAPTSQTPVYDYIVGIVNLTFAAELLLKACLGCHLESMRSQAPKHHDLHKLWTALPVAVRSTIGERGIIINEAEMDTAFNEFRGAFSEWRYIHEDYQRKQPNAENLLRACYALIDHLDPGGLSMDGHLAKVGSNLARESAKRAVRRLNDSVEKREG